MPPRLPAAGLFRRLAAGCYDLLVLAGVLMLTSFLVIVARGGVAVPAGNSVYEGFLAIQVGAFFIGFWCCGGKTPGMRAWHLRVETAQGGTLTLAAAAKRFGATLVSAAPAGLGFLWMLADPERRTWHDRFSGTRIVRLLPSSGEHGCS